MRFLSLCTVGLLSFGTAVAGPQDDTDARGAEAAPSVVALKARHVHVRPGKVLDDATVLVRDGRVIAVGADVAVPDGAQVLQGHTVCAGFIDGWSSLAVDAASVRDTKSNAATRSTDALDPYGSAHERAEAVRAGVLMARVQVGQTADIGGLGAIVRTGAAGDAMVVQDEANLATAVGIGSGSRRPDVFDRVEQVDRLIGKLVAGQKYREDLLEYEEKLAEWEAEIAEKVKKLEKDFKKAKKARDKDIEEAEEDGEEHKEKKYKEDKKPKAPKLDAEKEQLARAADGELPVLVRIEGAAELRALLNSAAMLPRVRWVLAGDAACETLARPIAEAGIPVLLRPTPLADSALSADPGNDLGLAGRLHAAGVEVLFGTGSATSRQLPLLAGLAVSHGLDAEHALHAVTLGPARAFDVADRVGTVQVGRHAELLLLDGPPLAGSSRVVAALSAGDVVLGPGSN